MATTQDISVERQADQDHAPRAPDGAGSVETLQRISLQTYALAAVAESLAAGLPAGNNIPEIRFLLVHLQAVDPDRAGWATTLLDYLRQPSVGDRPLFYLARQWDLTVFEMLVTALVAAVEDDVMVGRVLAHVQAPLGGSRPTVGLLSSALAETLDSNVRPANVLATGAAAQSGLLTLADEGLPLPERTVRAPLHLTLALNGRDGLRPGTTIGLSESMRIPLPPSILHEARRQAAGLMSAPGRVLVLRSGSPVEGKSVAAAIADILEQRPLFIETGEVGELSPWLMLRGLLPIFYLEIGPGERKALPRLPYYSGPILVVCGPDGSVEAAGEPAMNWTIPVPPRGERQALWQSALQNSDLAAELALHHRHTSSRIAHLGRLARQQSALNGRTQPTAEDVFAASWSGEGGGLDALAQPLTERIPDEALVLTDALQRDLDALLMRCRVRDGLVENLGASAAARYMPGVRSLFVGPSGTGKTLAAGWLAARLGLPLYRVDLASVTSKYIGETEKNLSQLLARAEQAEVVLLFDEADSLFGKRTDVQQANDRFANAQTNYLLQRIESYDGITILTSNSRSRFDNAFARRLDMIVEFPLPGPKERRRLWLSHLGEHHRVAGQDLNQLAIAADLAGGNIRNVVLTAAVLAQTAERPIEYGDIVAGLVGEYRKLGKQMPSELRDSS